MMLEESDFFLNKKFLVILSWIPVDDYFFIIFSWIRSFIKRYTSIRTDIELKSRIWKRNKKDTIRKKRYKNKKGGKTLFTPSSKWLITPLKLTGFDEQNVPELWDSPLNSNLYAVIQKFIRYSNSIWKLWWKIFNNLVWDILSLKNVSF